MSAWYHEMDFTNAFLSRIVEIKKYPVIMATACFVSKAVVITVPPLSSCIASRNFLTSPWVKSII